MGLRDIIELSRFYGANKEYVIAGGGNTSFKNDEYIWVKASGIPLAGIDEDGFVGLSRKKLQTISLRTYSTDVLKREEEVKNDLMNSIVSDTGRRPSVESSLHNIINYPLVVHTHPTLGNSLLCSNHARDLTLELWGGSALYLEYIDPGYILFKRVANDLADFRALHGCDPKIIMLENHGVFVGGNNQKEIRDIYHAIEHTLRKKIKGKLPPVKTGVISSFMTPALQSQYPKGQGQTVKGITSALIREFLQDEQSFYPIATAFTPDHIVYCKSHYLMIDENKEEKTLQQMQDFRGKYGYYPKVIALKGKGLLIMEENESAATIVADLIINMMKISYYARSFGGSKPLNPHQISFIENWEAENYRKKIAEK